MKRVYVAAFLSLLLVQSSCNLIGPSGSKVRAGELFEVAHDKYDPYFKEVHAIQREAATWDTQKGAARRPLVDALKLDPDVADVTLAQATHERMLGIAREAGNVKLDVVEGRGRVVAQNASKVDDAGRSLFGAIETCVKSELDRAKALREIPVKADALVKQGRALEPQVSGDLSRRGMRASKQVQEEMQASYEVLAEHSKQARLLAREAEDFVADLRRAVGSDISESAARPSSSAKPSGSSAPPKRTPKPDKTEAAETPKPPPPKPTEKPAEKPPEKAEKPDKPAEAAPKPPPPAKSDEFNP